MIQFKENTIRKYVDSKLIFENAHPHLPIKIYKYSQNTVMERKWDNITIQMRGTVLDENYKRVSNPMPKFWNIEELEGLGISLPKCGYKIFDKLDGSLIEVFRYKDNIIVATAGSFISIQAEVAEKMLYEKYSKFIENIKDNKTYLFEFIHPENKIVVSYSDEEKLTLIAVRNLNGYDEKNLDKYKKYGLNIVEEIDMSIEEMMKEKIRPDFINKEGFVIRYDNGFRVKVKYSEYFRLHKLITGVNEKFVWEFLAAGKEIELENIPDEVFDFIKKTKKHFNIEFGRLKFDVFKMYHYIVKRLILIYGHYNQKDFAMMVLPKYKEFSGMLFRIEKGESIDALVWKRLKPEYEKGVTGFQSMKQTSYITGSANNPVNNLQDAVQLTKMEKIIC